MNLDPYKSLKKVQSKKGKLFASASPNFGYAIFARDAIEACLDLIPTSTKEITQPLARNVIKTLAELQGVTSPEDIKKNKRSSTLTKKEKQQLIQLDLTEERKGKIHHEHRSLNVDGETIPERGKMILTYLSGMWGGTPQEVTYYGSVDATPQYIRLIYRYCLTFGNDILSLSYLNKKKERKTVKDSLFLALTYLAKEIDSSDIGLYEMKYLNPQGLRNQTWKDSPPSFIDTDGALPNYEKPMAPLCLQGLAYDALIQGGILLKEDFPEEVLEWRKKANHIQKETLRRFWMDKEQYFSLVLFRDDSSTIKQVKTISSDPGVLLETTIFDTVSDNEKQLYVGGIAKTIYSKEFLTDVGVRCRSLKHASLVNYSDYHGTEAVWPKETYDIIQGLRNQGFPRLAEQLGVRIINSVLVSSHYFELFIVRPDGRVNYNPLERNDEEKSETIFATSIPEAMQTWTISAYIAETDFRKRDGYNHIPSDIWQYHLEDRLLSENKNCTLLKTKGEIEKAFPKKYHFTVNVQEGQKRAKRYETILVDLFAPGSDEKSALVHEA